MERIVCGDVGFGKTEVAMRAAFVAAQAGKQVAVLAPTTLLVQQHLSNFRDRFADWPVRIEGLSRFGSGAETQAALAGLEQGQGGIDRKSTRLNSSHLAISYAVLCLKKTPRRRSPARLNAKQRRGASGVGSRFADPSCVSIGAGDSRLELPSRLRGRHQTSARRGADR